MLLLLLSPIAKEVDVSKQLTVWKQVLLNKQVSFESQPQMASLLICQLFKTLMQHILFYYDLCNCDLLPIFANWPLKPHSSPASDLIVLTPWLTGCSECTKTLKSWRVYHIFALKVSHQTSVFNVQHIGDFTLSSFQVLTIQTRIKVKAGKT